MASTIINQEVALYRLVMITSMFLLFLILIYVRRQVFILAETIKIRNNYHIHKTENFYRAFLILLFIIVGIVMYRMFPDGIYIFLVIILGINILIKLRFIIQQLKNPANATENGASDPATEPCTNK